MTRSLLHQYSTIVADPPWPLEEFPAKLHGDGSRLRVHRKTIQPDGRLVERGYRTMPLKAIQDLPVRALAKPGAHLYLWTINDHLEDAFGVARAWGFEPAATLVWCKAPKGRGFGGKFASNVEFILFCRRPGVLGHVEVTSYLADAAERKGISRTEVDAHMGTSHMAGWWLSRLGHRARVPTPEQFARLKAFLGAGDEMDEAFEAARKADWWSEARCNTRWWQWPRGRHSQKPEAFQDIVEQVSPGPYLELFARRKRLGWDVWGDEVESDLELAA